MLLYQYVEIYNDTYLGLHSMLNHPIVSFNDVLLPTNEAPNQTSHLMVQKS